ncbi:epoxide hydrolase family protein [Novosphingobium mangrovi (ex Huang et al. 2023)]|uniref:Epoxide hydrolase n=1 Tax=Novosphingobium mangrovi (ex Huang et al. 2023) TaxID=2976432 RepID=A0ABT2I6V0_9SPHN|nr:epoxide hydrolase family protein [Novosphingobium mangrovi (ex Huang et al. 2023)]MCT2400537.1 epoxide hydrolase [Novosphingobium mangrovi (ex Huang et al. 2023)]
MTEIRPFRLAIPEAQIDDLKRRIAMTRWPEKEPVDDWSQGTPLGALQRLLAYWADGYDWRRCEARLNGFGQYLTEIDGLDIHFIHVPSPHPQAVPLILTHGWPGSVVEFMEAIGPLSDPVAHGGRAEDAFHVVVPSLPGYGFSGKPTAAGWNVDRIGRAWAELMRRLGYERWLAQGGDWGAIVTTVMGGQAPLGLAGIHTNMPVARPTREDYADPSAEVAEARAAGEKYKQFDSGYSAIQSTRPQTIGYGLVDSPAALAGWIYEKMWSWTDNQGEPEDALSMDAILDNISLYWFSASGASAARLYWESFGAIAKSDPVEIPAAVSTFPREITKAPRKWAERLLRNIVYWNAAERGGHFAAWEEPALFVEEVRKAFALMR